MTKLNLLQGTLDLIVLKVLSTESLHGYAIAQKVREISSDRLSIEEGSLYPALYRMERKGWIESRWQNTEKQRRARIYALTAAGLIATVLGLGPTVVLIGAAVAIGLRRVG